MARFSLKSSSHWRAWSDLIVEVAADNLCAAQFVKGLRSPVFWDSSPIALTLADAAASFRSDPQWCKARLAAFDALRKQTKTRNALEANYDGVPVQRTFYNSMLPLIYSQSLIVHIAKHIFDMFITLWEVCDADLPEQARPPGLPPCRSQ